MNKFLPLYEYLNIAEKIFIKRVRRKPSEDEVAFVAEYLMRADNKYNDDIGSKEGFRGEYGKFAILKIMRDKAVGKNKHDSLDFPISYKKGRPSCLADLIPAKTPTPEANLSIKELLDKLKNLLSEREYDILIRSKMYREPQKNISQDYKISRQRIDQINKASIKKIRDYVKL